MAIKAYLKRTISNLAMQFRTKKAMFEQSSGLRNYKGWGDIRLKMDSASSLKGNK